jgi:hypothetical protein
MSDSESKKKKIKKKTRATTASEESLSYHRKEAQNTD